jgi:Protein of unknown function (DUF3551)
MRKITSAMMAAVGVAGVTMSTPAAAQSDSWCLQGREIGIPGDCTYASLAQCQASASGRDGTCNVNPRAALGRAPPVPYGRRAYPYGSYR